MLHKAQASVYLFNLSFCISCISAQKLKVKSENVQWFQKIKKFEEVHNVWNNTRECATVSFYFYRLETAGCPQLFLLFIIITPSVNLVSFKDPPWGQQSH